MFASSRRRRHSAANRGSMHFNAISEMRALYHTDTVEHRPSPPVSNPLSETLFSSVSKQNFKFIKEQRQQYLILLYIETWSTKENVKNCLMRGEVLDLSRAVGQNVSISFTCR